MSKWLMGTNKPACTNLCSLIGDQCSLLFIGLSFFFNLHSLTVFAPSDTRRRCLSLMQTSIIKIACIAWTWLVRKEWQSALKMVMLLASGLSRPELKMRHVRTYILLMFAGGCQLAPMGITSTPFCCHLPAFCFIAYSPSLPRVFVAIRLREKLFSCLDDASFSLTPTAFFADFWSNHQNTIDTPFANLVRWLICVSIYLFCLSPLYLPPAIGRHEQKHQKQCRATSAPSRSSVSRAKHF